MVSLPATPSEGGRVSGSTSSLPEPASAVSKGLSGDGGALSGAASGLAVAGSLPRSGLGGLAVSSATSGPEWPEGGWLSRQPVEVFSQSRTLWGLVRPTQPATRNPEAKRTSNETQSRSGTRPRSNEFICVYSGRMGDFWEGPDGSFRSGHHGLWFISHPLAALVTSDQPGTSPRSVTWDALWHRAQSGL